jgi:hypothetical protein
LSGAAWSRYRHYSGRISLFELRGKEQFTTPPGINLFLTRYAHIFSWSLNLSQLILTFRKVLKCIAEHVNPTEDLKFWLETIPQDDPRFNLSKCNLRTAHPRHEA